MRDFRARLLAAALAVVAGAAVSVLAPSPQARAQDCPGNPGALGTSRVITIDPADFTRVGRMQYPRSLPLADKEVVLTFDDGPLPPYSNQILDILAAQCVKVTYFLVGSMARAYPETVRRMFEAGHTIGTHSEHHPSRMAKLPLDRIRQEIDAGIADVGTALGDPRGVAPFFRIPGLDRSDAIESELAARSLIVFSSDTVADDWHHRIKPNQIVALALSRLEARGGGILLLHDIHPTTVAALPDLLKGLKDKGFHIVQVVPTAPDRIEVAGDARTRMLASAMPDRLVIDDTPAQPAWPPSTAELNPDDAVLPAPDASAFDPDTGLTAAAGEARWPDRPQATAPSAKKFEVTAPRANKLALAKSAVPMVRQQHEVAGMIDQRRVWPDRLHAGRHVQARDATSPRADAFSGFGTPSAVSTSAH